MHNLECGQEVAKEEDEEGERQHKHLWREVAERNFTAQPPWGALESSGLQKPLSTNLASTRQSSEPTGRRQGQAEWG